MVYLVYPLDYNEGTRYPLIMSVHGGPESHDKDGWVTNYSRPGQMGAARGYAVYLSKLSSAQPVKGLITLNLAKMTTQAKSLMT